MATTHSQMNLCLSGFQRSNVVESIVAKPRSYQADFYSRKLGSSGGVS